MSSWQRTFWVVWVANCITALGMQAFLPFFASHIETLGVEDPKALAVWAGLVYGAAPLSAAVMSPAWGMLGDRFGRKLMVLRAMVALTVFVGAMAFVRSPGLLLALRIGQGIFSGFIPPSVTLVSVGAPPERQGRVAGSLAAAMAIGSIGGPMIGTAVGVAFGTHAVFLVTAGLAAVSTLLVGLFAHEDASHRRAPGGPISWRSLSPRAVLGTFARDLSELAQNRGLRGAVILLFLVQFGLGSSNPQLELFVRQLGGIDGRVGAGLLFTGLAVAAGISMPLWGRYGDRVGHRNALVATSTASAVVLLLHAAAPSYGWLLAARVALGLTAGGVAPVAFGVAAAETPVDRRGAAFGAVFSARALAVAIGASAGGWIAAGLGVRGLFLVCALVIGGSILVARRGSEPRGAERAAGDA